MLLFEFVNMYLGFEVLSCCEPVVFVTHYFDSTTFVVLVYWCIELFPYSTRQISPIK